MAGEYGFALWVGLGAALGLLRVARGVPQRQVGVWLNISLLVLLGALIGARLFYAGVHWSYFSTRAVEIGQFWLGGLSWPGAVLGAWLALLALAATYRTARGSRVPLGVLADRLYPLLPPIAITAWLGSWQIGAAYGSPLPPGTWWAVPTLDSTGLYNPHWPLQPVAALSLLLFFFLLERAAGLDQPRGLISATAFLGMLINLLAAALLRADPVPRLQGIPLDAWACVVFLAILMSFLVIYNLLPRVWRKQTLSNGS
jgi:prolipoprotein diacylglyceryltransferase